MFVNENIVTLEDHQTWFQHSLVSSFRKLYIGVIAEEKVGVCRFDYSEKKNCAEVSITLNPFMREKKLSHELLFFSIKKYHEVFCYKLHATVKRNNLASLKIFQKNNFVQYHEDDKFYFLQTL
jgi:RimJ/RimL family protein N-acetyltransferase